MCLGSKSSQSTTPTPAPAPAAAEPAPKETEVGAARKAEEKKAFGDRGPTTRIDRSLTGGVSGGSGLAM